MFTKDNKLFEVSPVRLFNPRVLVIMALGVCFGCFFPVMLYISNITMFVLGIVFFLFVLNIILTLYKKPKAKLIVAGAFFILTLLSCFLPIIALSKRANARVYNDKYMIDCVLVERLFENDETWIFLADKIYIDGNKIDVKAYVEIVLSDELKASGLKDGSCVRLMDASISNIQLISSYGVNTYSYSENAVYYIQIDGSMVTDSQKELKADIFSLARYRIFHVLSNNLPNTYAETGYALLTNKKAFTDKTISVDFRNSGLSHILAVSGLHITFLITMLNFIFKFIPLKKEISLIILAIILIFYSGLCSFSPSVLRAVIMGILYSLAKCRGYKPDSICNLSIAVILILVFAPLLIVDLRFILSFLSVLSILCLNVPLNAILRKTRVPNKILDAVSVTLAATIGLLPVITIVFKSISLWTIFANLVAIPISMILFLSLMLFTVLALIVPSISFLLGLTRPLFFLFLGLTRFFAGLKYAQFILFGSTLTFVVFYLCLIFPNRYNLLNGKLRRLASLSSVFILCLTLVLSNIPSKQTVNSVSLFGQSSGNACVFTVSERIIVAGDLQDFDAIENYLVSERIRDIDIIIIASSSFRDLYDYTSFAIRFNAEEIWLNTETISLSDWDIDELKDEDKIKYYDGNYLTSKSVSENFKFRAITSKNKQIGIEILLENKFMLCLNSHVLENALSVSDFYADSLFALCTRTDAVSPSYAENRLAQYSYGKEGTLSAEFGVVRVEF